MDELTLDQKKSNVVVQNGSKDNTNTVVNDNLRQHPKINTGNTNHWASVVTHVQEYDKEMNQKMQLHSKKEKILYSNKLNEQMDLKKKTEAEKLQKEKQMDLTVIKNNMENADKEQLKRLKHFGNLQSDASEVNKTEILKRNQQRQTAKLTVEGVNDLFVDKLIESPVKTHRQKNIVKQRLSILRQEKESSMIRKEHPYEMDQKYCNSLEMHEEKQAKSPQELRRGIRLTMEDENRRNATDKKKYEINEIKREKDVVKHFFNDNKKFHENPDLIRRKIRANLELENSKLIQRKNSSKNRLSKSLDFGNATGPLQLLEEHYKGCDQRNERIKSYASALKSNIANVKNYQKNMIDRELQEDTKTRVKIENDYKKNSQYETDRHKQIQKSYANDLEFQMKLLNEERHNQFKMNQDIKAINKTILQPYKENNVDKKYAQIPGWSDNSYKRTLFQKVPKRENDFNKDRIYNQSKGMADIFNAENRLGGKNSGYATAIRIDKPMVSKSVNLTERQDLDKAFKNLDLKSRKVNFGNIAQ